MNSSMIHLIHCKNLCKCHNVRPPNTTIKEKKHPGLLKYSKSVRVIRFSAVPLVQSHFKTKSFINEWSGSYLGKSLSLWAGNSSIHLKPERVFC
jgi:hypothetical protein